VIAEGIETQQQAELLRGQGCLEGQGYLYSQPVPAGEFCKLLQPSALAG
jgi:EAL domain-containing protein (putative c-di-GMP-specific phosphodiesterase class I)